jgi:hypothetical protein
VKVDDVHEFTHFALHFVSHLSILRNSSVWCLLGVERFPFTSAGSTEHVDPIRLSKRINLNNH